MAEEKVQFGAGCFWSVEQAFRQIPGVLDAPAGYAGGHLEHPSYEQVCSGTTDHAEVVEVTYDPDRVSFTQLLKVFFAIHDPTQMNRQGWDIGTQYRSAIFFTTEEQRVLAQAMKDELIAAGHRVVTEITPASLFWRAEEYHQRYNERHGRTCRPLPPELFAAE